ncbi:MAG: thiol:disulfide interchange protein DsbA/DsbL [Pseudomonadales bacterium]|nr:thiol:disulfide interchange protein DsbA/DsbL [Pseudomonadales bacterium]
MNFFSKPLRLLVIFCLASLPFGASVNAQPAIYVDGTHYETLDTPVRTSDPAKIEVTEIFWYGCPHCYAFEPLLHSWTEQLPADVTFVRSPGMWNQMMEVHAQIYYVAEAMGVLDKIHDLAFNEIHQRGNYLQNQGQVKALFVSQGVNGDDFDKTWKSFAISSKVKQASTKMRDYGVRGVPSMVVNGKYRVTAGGALATQADVLKVVDFLVQKERKAS